MTNRHMEMICLLSPIRGGAESHLKWSCEELIISNKYELPFNELTG